MAVLHSSSHLSGSSRFCAHLEKEERKREREKEKEEREKEKEKEKKRKENKRKREEEKKSNREKIDKNITKPKNSTGRIVTS